MEKNAKIEWTWVAISRPNKRVSRSTCKDFDMQVFMGGLVGAKVFFSEDLAKKFRTMLMANEKLRRSYSIQIVSDHELMRECEEFIHNKFRR